jgi:hypothetical protein
VILLPFKVPDALPRTVLHVPRDFTADELIRARASRHCRALRLDRRAPCMVPTESAPLRLPDVVRELLYPLIAAITVSQVGQATSNDGGPYVVASFSMEPGRYYLAVMNSYAFSGTAGALSATNWAEPAESASGGRLYNSNLCRLHVRERVVGSTVTGTVSWSGTNVGVGATVAILEFQGINTSDPCRQIVFNSTTGNDPNPLTLTLAALGDATNNCVALCGGASGASTFTTATGFTELYDAATPAAPVMTSYDAASPSAAPSTTNSVGFLDFALVGIEINVASAGTAISAGLDTLVITEQAAAVKLSKAIAAAVDALTISEQSASVKLSRAVAASFDSLVITEQAATVNRAVSLAAGLDVLAITEQAATITLAKAIAAAADALVIAEQQASVTVGTNIAAAVDTLTITEAPAIITLARHVAAAVDALQITERQAAVQVEQGIMAGVDALVLTEHQATTALGKAVQAGVDALTLSELAAVIRLAKSVQAEMDALVITEHQAVTELARAVLATRDQLLISEHQATVVGVEAIIMALARRYTARAPRGSFTAAAPRSKFRLPEL